MASRKTRIVATVEGVLRNVLAIEEHRSGDLIVEMYQRQFAGGPPSPFLRDDPDEFRGIRAKQFRYTFHVSPNSPTTNTIKLHDELEDGTYRTHVYYTTAIKERTGIAPVFARLCSKMKDDGYVSKPRASDSIFDLGAIEHRWFTLMYAIFVGPAGSQFSKPSAANVLTLDFKCFRFFFVWSFLTIGATAHSRLNIVSSIVGDGASDGLPPDGCVPFFDDFRENLKAAMVEVLGAEPGLQEVLPVIRAATYVPEADRQSYEYALWIAQLEWAASLVPSRSGQ